jgi:hypothetical protein
VTAVPAGLVAARDQARAWVRDMASAGEPVLLVDVAQGEPCGWCGCPADAPESEECRGCSATADAVLRIYPAPPPELGDAWPVCTTHGPDALAVLQIYMASAAAPD